MKGRKLTGKQVVGARGWKIGKVKDLVFDENSWKIVSLEVELNRTIADEYQMRKILSRSSIEVGVGSVQAVGDEVILSVNKTELRRIISNQANQSSQSAPEHSPTS